MSHLPIWYIEDLDAATCDRVVAELSALPSREATMGMNGEEKQQATRDTVVRFADHNYWLSDRMEQVAFRANTHCGWDYHITGREAIQFAEYNPGQHYAWHTDTFTLAGQPVDRKLTVLALLNDDFTGGDFEVRLYGDYKAPMRKGAIIAFPSILEHRCTPVLTGKRFSAAMWLNGPRFR